jgi:hypothetical protein
MVEFKFNVGDKVIFPVSCFCAPHGWYLARVEKRETFAYGNEYRVKIYATLSIDADELWASTTGDLPVREDSLILLSPEDRGMDLERKVARFIESSKGNWSRARLWFPKVVDKETACKTA